MFLSLLTGVRYIFLTERPLATKKSINTFGGMSKSFKNEMPQTPRHSAHLSSWACVVFFFLLNNVLSLILPKYEVLQNLTLVRDHNQRCRLEFDYWAKHFNLTLTLQTDLFHTSAVIELYDGSHILNKLDLFSQTYSSPSDEREWATVTFDRG